MTTTGAGALPAKLADLAEWSQWRSWDGARAYAPRLPGVYLFRVGGATVYVGMAGERAGLAGDRRPKGLWGRLGRYQSGRAAASGFGEAALDRALADPGFVRARLDHLEALGPERTLAWAVAAIHWLAPEVCWAVTPTGLAARELELAVIDVLRAEGADLWNR